jgi:hypothetical protein
MKNEPQIGRRPIKGDFTFLVKFCWKMSLKSAEGRCRGISHFKFNCVAKWIPNRLKADIGGYYIFNLILLGNEPQIGRSPIKSDILFFIYFWKQINKFYRNFDNFSSKFWTFVFNSRFFKLLNFFKFYENHIFVTEKRYSESVDKTIVGNQQKFGNRISDTKFYELT